MKTSRRQREGRGSSQGFTVLELLVATTVFAMLIGFLVVIVDGVQKAWIQGDQKVEIYQNGRAIMELVSRELSRAVVSDRIQFVQTPDLSGKVPNLAPNSPSLFWMAPGKSTEKGNLCEVGYYLTRDDAAQSYQLNRFYVTPDYDGSSTERPNYYLGAKNQPDSFANAALWVTNLDSAAFDPKDSKGVVSVAADGVVGLWIRCLDIAGNPIPWLSDDGKYSAGTIQFNSGASFQMAAPDAPFEDHNNQTFVYGAAPTTTKAANRLPGSVEITMILVDTRSLLRNPVIPFMPDPKDEKEVPSQIETFQEDLVKAGIKSARTFTATVKLENAHF